MTTKPNPLAVMDAVVEMFQEREAPLAAARIRKARAAVAELVDCADTVAHYNKFTAPDEEYIEIPRGTVDKLVAALAAFEVTP